MSMVEALYASTMQEDAPCWTLELAGAWQPRKPCSIKRQHLRRSYRFRSIPMNSVLVSHGLFKYYLYLN
jgi:hypothetical protein